MPAQIGQDDIKNFAEDKSAFVRRRPRNSATRASSAGSLGVGAAAVVAAPSLVGPLAR